MLWFLLYSGLGIFLSIALGLFPKHRYVIVLIGICAFAAAFFVARQQNKKEDHLAQTVCTAVREAIKEEIPDVENLPELQQIKKHMEALGLPFEECFARLEQGTKLDQGIKLMLERNLEEAASLLGQNADESRQESAKSYYYLGKVLYNLEAYSEAANALERSVNLFPESPAAWTNWGITLAALGNNEEALKKYQKAINIKSEFARAYYCAGVALAELKKFGEAKDMYEKAIRYRPDYSDAWNNLGNILYSFREYEQALDKHQEAVRIDPDFSLAHYNLGNDLKALGRYKDAISEYQKAIELEPDFAEAYHNWAETLIGLEDYEGAISLLNKAVEKNPKLAGAYFSLGEAHRQLGNDYESIENYRKAMDLDLRYRLGPYAPGRYYESLRDFD